MTNYEAYKKEVITQLGTGDCVLCSSALAAKNKECSDMTCSECRKLTADWLNEEYKETDWSNVEVDTPVRVSNSELTWLNRYFARFENGTVYTWANGATSWSTDNFTETWKHTKLYRGEYENH